MLLMTGKHRQERVSRCSRIERTWANTPLSIVAHPRGAMPIVKMGLTAVSFLFILRRQVRSGMPHVARRNGAHDLCAGRRERSAMAESGISSLAVGTVVNDRYRIRVVVGRG